MSEQKNEMSLFRFGGLVTDVESKIIQQTAITDKKTGAIVGYTYAAGKDREVRKALNLSSKDSRETYQDLKVDTEVEQFRKFKAMINSVREDEVAIKRLKITEKDGLGEVTVRMKQVARRKKVITDEDYASFLNRNGDGKITWTAEMVKKMRERQVAEMMREPTLEVEGKLDPSDGAVNPEGQEPMTDEELATDRVNAAEAEQAAINQQVEEDLQELERLTAPSEA